MWGISGVNELNRRYKKYAVKQQVSYTLVNLLFFLCIFIPLVYIVFYYTNNGYYNYVDKGILKVATELSGRETPLTYLESNKYPDYMIAYYDSEGHLIERYGNNLMIRVHINEKGNLNQFYNAEIDGHGYRVFTMEHATNGFSVKVVRNIDQMTYIREVLLKYILVAIAIVFCISVLVSVALSYIQTRPYRKAMSRGQLFTSNMSHEIGTPLAVIQANLQSVLTDDICKEEKIVSKIVGAIDEVKRLKKMSEELLTLTRADNDNLNFQYTECDLKEILNTIIEPSMLLAEMQDKTLSFNENGIKRNVNIDTDKIKQVILAIIDNSLKNTQAGDNIEVSIDYNIKNYKITVKDTGRGVKEEELQYIFDRFFRSAENRAVGISGSGLGLSIVYTIIVGMGGKIMATNNIPKGFVIEIILPYTLNN